MRFDLPRIIVLLCVFVIAAGIALNGIGLAEIQRMLTDLAGRPGGSLSLRFILQPVMSTIFATRDGIKDARTGRSPYFWTVLSNSQQRGGRLREGLTATGKVVILAMLLDGAYQVIEFKTVFPVEALIIALLLGFVPYLLLRGPIARIARWWFARKSTGPIS